MSQKRGLFGFTLVELLIALAILGVIATFTIPKILTAQQNERNEAIAKETAAMISAAYQQAQHEGVAQADMVGYTLTQYMNYVSADTTSIIDDRPGIASYDCASQSCIKLHNGGVLLFRSGESFGGTGADNGIPIIFDPDGVYSGSTADSPGKSVIFVLYYSGKLTSFGFIPPPCFYSSIAPIGPAPDPSWFSW